MLVHGGQVLLPDRSEPEPLDIVVEGDKIADIVPRGSVTSEAMERFDAADKLVIPGLVNGHHHAQGQLVKGMFNRVNLELLLVSYPWSNAKRTVEDKYLSALIGAAELLRKGCTASYDMCAEIPQPTFEGVEAVARAYSDVGMRATVAPMMADRTFYQAIPGLVDALPQRARDKAKAMLAAPRETMLASCRNILSEWKLDRSRVRPALGPTIPHHCSDAFLIGCRDLAEEFNVGMQMHVAESRLQAVVAEKVYGKTLIAHLDALKMLNPGFCAAHAVWLTADDCARLADRGASISHNPGSNLKLGSGMADIRTTMDHGVNLALGSDGTSSSDNLNLFEVMRLASYLSRVHEHPVDRWVEPIEVLRAATEGGARALGFAKIGRIEKGYFADLTFIDLGALHYVPANNIISQLVFAEDGTGVHSVMIGGKLVLDDRRLVNADIGRMRRQAEAAVARLAEDNAETRATCEMLSPYVRDFCSGLSASPLSINRLCQHQHE
jgi:guanine deaminase